MEDTACVVLDTTDDEELRKLIESEEEDNENVILPEEEDEGERKRAGELTPDSDISQKLFENLFVEYL